tara:strand:- start:1904 stop:2989 length:1086 start_codon:yes stop_codon:yes gene_type:complete
MKYATVCSGVEACSVAWESLGWQPVFFSEIEDFPSQVLSTHYPSVPNHRDMTNFEEWGYERGAVDVICGGTPCQSFSVAGLRKGLSDDRGNLALTFCRMVQQLRPKYFIWENVPGCLSSNGGRDFGSITGAMAKFGYVFGWRVLDAQYFGVPQRRRRLFLIGCSSGHIGDIRQVLFDTEGGKGNSEKSGEAEQGSAEEITGCTDRGSKRINTLDTQCGLEKMTHQSLASGHYVVETFDQQRYDQWGTNKTASTVKARDYKDVTDMVVYECHHTDSRVKELDQTCQTVTSRWRTEKLVRRLTPIEAERLQGFPDDYTNILWRGKTAPDMHRYKAMGNSMAVPVMRWLGNKIQILENKSALEI